MLKIAKFYDMRNKTKYAFQEFVEMNSWAVDKTKSKEERIIMKDGTEFYFITLEDREKSTKIQGMQFHVGGVKGGSNTAWCIAKKHNIPCFNLYKEEDRKRLQEWLNE